MELRYCSRHLPFGADILDSEGEINHDKVWDSYVYDYFKTEKEAEEFSLKLVEEKKTDFCMLAREQNERYKEGCIWIESWQEDVSFEARDIGWGE